MDINVLWNDALALIQKQTTPMFFDTYIKNNLTPVRLEGNILVLQAAIFNLISMVTERQQMINDCLSEAAGTPILTAFVQMNPMNATSRQDKSQLNPDYTFETFVVGKHSNFAHACATNVAARPAQGCNPLFIYGGVGLGKTHLMHAIGHQVLRNFPDMKVLYMTSEDFTNQLIDSIRLKQSADFHNTIRSVDLLMVDDIQFIAGHTSTQEEFFNTFNALFSAGKQIILTSDRPPREIEQLEERLKSRFSGGMMADIKKPDLDTRMAILRDKAQRESIRIDNECLEMIATRVKNNVRELEGCLSKAKLLADLNNTPITREICWEAVKEADESLHNRVIDTDMVIRAVCRYYSLTPEEILSASRKREIVLPRQIAIYLTREFTNLSLPQIGKAFGRDHSTTLHACNAVQDAIKDSTAMKSVVDDIRMSLMER